MKGGLKDFDFYKLVCKTDETIYYIGSTSNMKRRVITHKNVCSNPKKVSYNSKTYKIMRANGGFDNFTFINLGNIKNVTKEEAHHTEQAFINLFAPIMNTYNSYSTNEDNKNKEKEWRDNNKEHQKVQRKDYRDKNKEKLKEYREENKEVILEQHKEYYKKNKKEINEKHKEKITCECGCIVRKSDLTTHKKTNKHIKLIEELV